MNALYRAETVRWQGFNKASEGELQPTRNNNQIMCKGKLCAGNFEQVFERNLAMCGLKLTLPPTIIKTHADAFIIGHIQRHLVAQPTFP